MDTKSKKEKRQKRHRRVRAKVRGTAKVPRFCVFRSGKHIYTQLIDDEKGKTIIAVSDQELKQKTATKSLKLKEGEVVKSGKLAIAYEVGKLIAQKSLEKKIEKVVFDRGGYKYHGKVKSLADGAREGGLKF